MARQRQETRRERQVRMALRATNENGVWGRSLTVARSTPYALLGVLLVAGILVGVLHNRAKSLGRVDPVLTAVQLMVFPAQRGGSAVQAGFSLNWNALFRGRALEAENARLKTEVARLQSENDALRKDAGEVERLRAAVGFVKANPAKLLPAEVIGWLPSPHSETITVARGTRDGVADRMIVRTPAGLVGQVIEPGLVSSQVLLLTDSSSGVGGLVRRGNKTLGIGIIEGLGRGQALQMVDLKRDDDIKPGDLVVTSGFGRVFPADVPVGLVESVKTEEGRFLKTARIRAFAPLPGDLREVFLLRP